MQISNWDKVSAVVASISLAVSVVALYTAYDGTKSTNRIASEALETSRQANQIAMGLVREPAVLEFDVTGNSLPDIDLTDPSALAGC